MLDQSIRIALFIYQDERSYEDLRTFQWNILVVMAYDL